MNLTNKQKQAIKSHWNYNYKLKFLKDGTLMVKRFNFSAWGILYTPEQTKQHLDLLERQK